MNRRAKGFSLLFSPPPATPIPSDGSDDESTESVELFLPPLVRFPQP